MDKYFKKFLQKDNLEKILELSFIENDTFSKLYHRSISLSRNIINNKSELKQLLENIKPTFYSITKTTPVENPKIYFIQEDVFKKYLQYSYHNKNYLINVVGSFLPASFLSLYDYLNSGSLNSALTYGLSSFLLITTLLTAFDYLLHHRTFKNSVGYQFKNKIFLPSTNKSESEFLLVHEYSHYIRFKKRLYTKNSFVEEGISQAIASKTLKKLPENRVENLLYTSLFNLQNLLFSYKFLAGYHKTKIHPLINKYYNAFFKGYDFNLNKPDKNIKHYIFGTVAVNLSELKYGESVYAEFFKGNNEPLLDY